MDDIYRAAVDAAAIFSETDLSGRITYVNEQFCSISGYGREELLGANHRILNSGLHEPEFFLEMWRALVAGRVWKGEICNRAKDGSLYWVDSTMVPLIDPQSGKVHKYVSIRFDVTEKRQLLHTLQWRVGHDVLTGLPNRAYLSDLLNQALAFSRREEIPLAVCMLDLDGFKAVNDGYGHAAGDLLLMEVAQRLQGILRAGDSVARLSGDEFVLILRHIDGSAPLHAALQRILHTLAAPYLIRERSLSLSASIGVTLFPQDDEDADTLVRHADQAMYVAKQRGRNRYHLFDVSQEQELKATHQTVARVRQALHQGELCLHYQPKVNMRTGQVLGFEALLRWMHPAKGPVPPGATRSILAFSGANRPDRRDRRMGHRPGLGPTARLATPGPSLVSQRQHRRPPPATQRLRPTPARRTFPPRRGRPQAAGPGNRRVRRHREHPPCQPLPGGLPSPGCALLAG